MWTRVLRPFAVCALGLASLSAHAEQNIEQRLAADPHGSVEIDNVSGSLDLQGWDKPEVEVTGTAGSDVDRVAVTGDPAHITVQVISRRSRLWGSEASARLIVHVPATSAVSATVVSADLNIHGLTGDVKLQSVSGEVQGDVGGDVRAGSVSGNIHLSARNAKSIALKSVSGDIILSGGSGETDVSSVSGTIKVEEGTQTRAHFKSVSGDVDATLGLGSESQLDGESVSGNIQLNIATIPAADFDVQTLSGDIENCFGPKPVQPKLGPGSRLAFKVGEGHAHVQISTKSGDVTLCTAHTPTRPSA
jgi:hypothetical protein